MRMWPADISDLRKIIKADVEFCLSKGLMDYSLLVAVERFQTGAVQKYVVNSKDLERASGNGVMAFGINSDEIEEENQLVKQKPGFFSLATPSAAKSISGKIQLNEYLSQKGYIDSEFNRHQFMSSDGQYIYHISLIDYLQVWNFSKISESFAKKWLLGKDGQKISAVQPKKYASRFLRFV